MLELNIITLEFFNAEHKLLTKIEFEILIFENIPSPNIDSDN